MTMHPLQPQPQPREGTDALGRRIDAPRRVSRGLRLKHRAGPEELAWYASRCATTLQSAFSTEARAEGLEYAISGQAANLRIEPGRVRASVQGRALRPYELTLRLAPWSNEQWSVAIEAMAREAAYTARMVNGELPTTAPAMMDRLGLHLWPAEHGTDLEASCTCGVDRCKHAWAVLCHLAERIADDPLILFSLRGMQANHLLDRLRERRNMLAQGQNVAHPTPPIAHAPPELLPAEECLSDFWRPGPTLTASRAVHDATHLPHALLRRLGTSPMQGRFPVVGLLTSAYDEVRRAALSVRDATEAAASNQGSSIPPERSS